MSGKVLFDPTSDKWVLSDGEHYLEVPHWAREIIADEFERETRQLNAENAALLEECDGWKKLCVDQEVMHVMHEEMLDNENAKLREQVDAAHMSRLLTENENDKLRELVRDMCVWAYIDSDCDLEDRFADRMRKLGVDA